MSEPSNQQEALNSDSLNEVANQLGMTRRDLLASGGFGLAGVVATTMVGCKTAGSKAGLNTTVPQVSTQKFLEEIELQEKATPVPAPSDPSFADAALKRNLAISGTIGRWLATKPYVMFQELLDQPSSFTVFKREIGPAIVFRHEHVIETLKRTSEFTVEPYFPEMKTATDGEYDVSKNNHYILGTDDDSLYRPDGMLLRRVLTPDDQEKILRPMIAAACKRSISGKNYPIDAVATLCRLVPVDVVDKYLGVHTFEKGTDSFMTGLKGGDTFDITSELTSSYKYTIKKGIVPDAQQMYEWVRGAFRNIFNNLSPVDPKYTQFRAEGRLATQFLSAYIHKVVLYYKEKVYNGDNNLPDTMVTRLLKLQKLVADGKGASLAAELKINETELTRRLEDGRIRSNVFGTVVGGVVNPEEGSARMIDSILRLKDGKYKVASGTSYADAVNAAKSGTTADNDILRKYALEALRLQPQGEVVVRKSQADKATIAGVTIPKGTLIFIAHAAAMRDKDVLTDPLAFDANRDEKLEAFEGKTGEDRPKEAPQSQIYLQHGFGRHKCLGRYASELTLSETLRTILLMGDVKRAGPLRMDEDGLYAVQLLLKA